MEKAIKEVVKEKYTEVVSSSQSCCGPDCCSPGGIDFSEGYEGLEGYTAEADLGLGCGLPTEFARIQKGHTVLDLGSGAGNDVFIARSLAGETGRVIGLDMTEAMIAQAEANNKKLGYRNIEFVLGDIEDMPLEDNSVDVAISNCVMNLVPDKKKAFSEVFRVLRPGGHFSISDIVLRGELPPAIQEAAVMYAGCVAGAMQKGDYLNVIEETGFTNIRIDKERQLNLPDQLLLDFLSPDELEAFRNSGTGIFSINIYGEKRS
ncbi:MAG: arsenite methyltransferase [Phaeodactylibacter sp.]|nr:arsenite methyltransferase [Phaeodactylibacter sp.]MCB9266261.1 arsenite methyltransferase [Lewinellaceae bacterium]MCB9285978.1 arsenite methyltransferase [Lewinellaceae bacterium]